MQVVKSATHSCAYCDIRDRAFLAFINKLLLAVATTEIPGYGEQTNMPSLSLWAGQLARAEHPLRSGALCV
jgi:hypothetical protein